MEKYKQTLRDEKGQLNFKIDKLSDFLIEYGALLPTVDQVLLYRQFDAMKQYSRILGERIMKWK